MEKIITHLWFDNQAEEAVDFYLSIFKNSKKGLVTRYTSVGQEFHKKEPGSVMTVEYEIEGRTFLALNGGPYFKFNESFSLMINCDTQEEIDNYWDRLGKEGEIQQCGWLKDKYGFSWQIVPSQMSELINDPDPRRSEKVLTEMFQMTKIDLNRLKKAREG